MPTTIPDSDVLQAGYYALYANEAMSDQLHYERLFRTGYSRALYNFPPRPTDPDIVRYGYQTGTKLPELRALFPQEEIFSTVPGKTADI